MSVLTDLIYGGSNADINVRCPAVCEAIHRIITLSVSPRG